MEKVGFCQQRVGKDGEDEEIYMLCLQMHMQKLFR